MIIGFTGTQHGMTQAQKDTVSLILKRGDPREVHHGLCIGADEQFHLICRAQGIPIVGHPPVITNKMAEIPHGEFRDLRPLAPYLVRNKAIVDAADLMIATPREVEEQLRSGTWSTIRYTLKKGKALMIVWPNGSVKALAL